ncbi:MAG: hypothetical protein AAFZ04_13145 [Pseudomonadota bacterium]
MKKLQMAGCAAIFGLCALIANGPVSAQSGHSTAMAPGAQIVEYTFKPYGAIQLAAMIKNIGGKTAVCGMWAETERLQAHIRAGNLHRRIRTTASVDLGNRRPITGLGFMKQVTAEDFKAGTQVPCRVTNVPWEAGFARQKIEFAAPRLRSRT